MNSKSILVCQVFKKKSVINLLESIPHIGHYKTQISEKSTSVPIFNHQVFKQKQGNKPYGLYIHQNRKMDYKKLPRFITSVRVTFLPLRFSNLRNSYRTGCNLHNAMCKTRKK